MEVSAFARKAFELTDEAGRSEVSRPGANAAMDAR
jgi:hypothetical protein